MHFVENNIAEKIITEHYKSVELNKINPLTEEEILNKLSEDFNLTRLKIEWILKDSDRIKESCFEAKIENFWIVNDEEKEKMKKWSISYINSMEWILTFQEKTITFNILWKGVVFDKEQHFKERFDNNKEISDTILKKVEWVGRRLLTSEEFMSIKHSISGFRALLWYDKSIIWTIEKEWEVIPYVACSWMLDIHDYVYALCAHK